MAARPVTGPANILLIHCDQHRADCLGCAGHPVLRTPNVDRLAREGVRFTHAFTPAPICTPERASLLTGQWPARHGSLSIPNTEQYAPADGELPVFPELLHEAGYRVGHVGKFHRETALRPTQRGVHDFVALGEYAAWRAERGLKPTPHANGFLGETDTEADAGTSRLAWGAERTLALLRDYADRGGPFFLRWDPVEPHLPCCPVEPYASWYDPAEVPPWPGFAEPLVDKPYIQAQQRRTWDLEGWSWDRWAPAAARYLAVISELDAQVGRLLTALDELGLAENTLVVYTTDHGDMGGSHGMIDKNYVMYDDVVRVPLVARLPGGLEGGAACDAFVSHAVDLASTFLHVAGVDAPETFAGRSLLDVVQGRDEAPREDILSVYYGAQFGSYSQRMVRDRRWKYVWNATDRDELYDLAGDPGEIENLAGRGDHAAQLARLRARLVAWMEETHDCLLNHWTRDQLLLGRSR